MVADTAFFMFVAFTFRNLGVFLVTNDAHLMIILIVMPAGTDFPRYELDWHVATLGRFAPDSNDVWHGIIVVFAWVVTWLIVGVAVFRKQDIKELGYVYQPFIVHLQNFHFI